MTNSKQLERSNRSAPLSYTTLTGTSNQVSGVRWGVVDVVDESGT